MSVVLGKWIKPKNELEWWWWLGDLYFFVTNTKSHDIIQNTKKQWKTNQKIRFKSPQTNDDNKYNVTLFLILDCLWETVCSFIFGS